MSSSARAAVVVLTLFASAPFAQEAELRCKNEAFEVDGRLVRVVEGFVTNPGRESLNAISWIESLQSIEACSGVVAKAESRFKRRESFLRTVEQLPEVYRNYFNTILAAAEKSKEKGRSSRVNILQKDIDSLQQTGVSAAEACAVVYGQWTWAASHHAGAFGNGVRALERCESLPLTIHRRPSSR